MKTTEVLLSSATTLPSTKKAFKLAAELQFDGLEIMPYRWTTVKQIADLAVSHSVPVRGVHFPFWWYTKPLWQVIASEQSPREWIYACIWWILFGPGHLGCSARKIMAVCPEAYCLIHPDTFAQCPSPEYFFFRQWDLFLENERPKKGEPAITHDPFQIHGHSRQLKSNFYRAKLMLDPGHIQIAQQMGKLPERTIAELFRELKPEGLHLSFSGEGRLHDLPTDREWRPLAEAIKEYPPEFIVVETKPGPESFKRVAQGRAILRRDLDI